MLALHFRALFQIGTARAGSRAHAVSDGSDCAHSPEEGPPPDQPGTTAVQVEHLCRDTD